MNTGLALDSFSNIRSLELRPVPLNLDDLALHIAVSDSPTDILLIFGPFRPCIQGGVDWIGRLR